MGVGNELGVIRKAIHDFQPTNAFNLLDNMDGLSAGVAFVVSLVLLLNAWLLGEFFISLVLVALIGSLLGFLVYNWHPASIFLGDCGSLFIGFTLAALTLVQRFVSHASSTYFPVLMPVLVLTLLLIQMLMLESAGPPQTVYAAASSRQKSSPHFAWTASSPITAKVRDQGATKSRTPLRCFVCCMPRRRNAAWAADSSARCGRGGCTACCCGLVSRWRGACGC